MANHVVGEEHVCRSQFRKKQKANAAAQDAASKLIWLALRNITADWGCAGQHWKTAINQFAILYPDRFTRPLV